MGSYRASDATEALNEKFSFLVNDYGYELAEKREENYGYFARYEKDERRVHIAYDYKDNFFYFSIVRGRNTIYPNDADQENIKAFYRLFEKYDPEMDFNKLQPDENQYLDALELNVSLLKEFGDRVLKGEEWI